MSYRFANLANRANLELREKTEDEMAAEQNVKIGISLQTDSGGRKNGTYSGASNLWQIFQDLGSSEVGKEGEEPVIVYMRREIVGQEALQNTTLQSMGLTGGRVLLRGFYKAPEKLQDQAGTFDIKIEKKAKEETVHRPMRATVPKSLVPRNL